MNDYIEWLQDITIYHKVDNTYKRYVKKAFVKNTSIQNRNESGINSVNNAIIRILDVEEYKSTWNISKGDIIVNKEVEDIIINAPITELRKKYGKENVYQVNSIDVNIYNDKDMQDLNNIKIGAI